MQGFPRFGFLLFYYRRKKEKDEGNLKKSEALACDVMMAAITSAKSE